MHNRVNCTICDNCNKVIASAPGFCRLCGHVFGETVAPAVPGVLPGLDVPGPGSGPSMYQAVVWERVAIDTADRAKKRLLKKIAV